LKKRSKKEPHSRNFHFGGVPGLGVGVGWGRGVEIFQFLGIVEEILWMNNFFSIFIRVPAAGEGERLGVNSKRNLVKDNQMKKYLKMN